ncbi:MAG: hypothetical protein CL528_00670 [Aequorivita sp.]|nr:hypothetical protein [Aequorivita sp.]
MIVARESSIGDGENAVSTQFDSSISSRICPQFFKRVKYQPWIGTEGNGKRFMFVSKIGNNYFFLTSYGSTVHVKANTMTQARLRYLRMIGKL